MLLFALFSHASAVRVYWMHFFLHKMNLFCKLFHANWNETKKKEHNYLNSVNKSVQAVNERNIQLILSWKSWNIQINQISSHKKCYFAKKKTNWINATRIDVCLQLQAEK